MKPQGEAKRQQKETILIYENISNSNNKNDDINKNKLIGHYDNDGTRIKNKTSQIN